MPTERTRNAALKVIEFSGVQSWVSKLEEFESAASASSAIPAWVEGEISIA
jgi:hypothetical protein